jgi:hypothetical protein
LGTVVLTDGDVSVALVEACWEEDPGREDIWIRPAFW